jgi:hypothetical protein
VLVKKTKCACHIINILNLFFIILGKIILNMKKVKKTTKKVTKDVTKVLEEVVRKGTGTFNFKNGDSYEGEYIVINNEEIYRHGNSPRRLYY